MGKVSNVYDALASRCVAVWPSHMRLPNPYKVEENYEQVLKQGFGIAFGAGENTNRMVSCELSVRREMLVILTRKVNANESNVTARVAVEKQLFEDQKLLIDDLESNPTLNDSVNVTSAIFVGDDGLNFVFGEKDNYIILTTRVSVEYFDNLN